ncbi:MAG: 23S rRNA (pseudouridine(1915)-N(3))-methyltransferase RlmH [Alphaproteobacteria bacterium]|nr:23S rRNA (pseudouridine(1915)-N(3))-methyltransferase RlmH [Alphaproteobacteria bacterium]
MRISISAVGRLKAGPETELSDRYRKRFDGGARALGLGPIAITEIPEARDGNPAVRKKDEAERLLGRIDGGSVIIALDEHGRGLDSQLFAELIRRYRDDGAGELSFLIGGADGHGAQVLSAARETLSLGPMTLPHGLARVVLLEQLYRALTILSGHPYHRA